jgi:probable DNA repair protein
MTNICSDNSTRLPGLLTQTLEYEALFTRLKADHTLITGNSRLSRVLKHRYNQWCASQGDRRWKSPDIISWNLWLDRYWETACLQGVTGTDHAIPGDRQLISLWESTLKDEQMQHALLRPESLASQLRDTRKLLSGWHIDMKDPSWFGQDNENHTAFYQWNKAFERRCKNSGWLSPEDRIAPLIHAIRGGHLEPLQTIDLLGFDEFSPAQEELLSALIALGSEVCELTITARQKKAVLWKSRDSKDELVKMARWVRFWHEKEPDSNIAVVVHDLETRRQIIDRHLQDILTPGHDQARLQPKPWNISMGTPLAREPMIETAFDLLKLLDKRIDIQDIGRVLRSPWLRGSTEERNRRALLEKCLRDKYPRQLKLGEVIYRSGEIKTHDHHHNELPEEQHEPQPWNSPALNALLKTLKRFESESRGLRLASAWAESFDQLLVSLGWPLAKETGDELPVEERSGEQDHNWQALQRWRESLRELASLDATTPMLGRKAAINQLKQICRETIFQPRTSIAPIQVLGLYEVNGLRFDHLWVVGLHNDNWPPSAKPNPFIPSKLQLAADLPSSSPQRELNVARRITRRLLATAPDCVFSFPGKMDGEDVLASPLLTNHDIEIIEEPPAWQKPDWPALIAGSDKPQIDELKSPGVLMHGTARGGSSILKHQALCPFRAFASNRLGADGMETPADGISPMLHGSLVHSVLEYFWKETKTQAALLMLDEDALGERVHKHVTHVTTEERGLQQRPAFREVEAERVFRHVMEFLKLDMQRDAFEVTGFEKEILPEIEGQAIRLIIDRVDTLPDGEEIIIDYKTGKVEPKKWFGERPEDPQLPLYAIAAGETPAAVVFGIIRDDGCSFKGVVTQQGLLPGLPPKETSRTRELVEAGQNMPETIENWRQTLHHMMSEFLAGNAAIDPKDGTRTCENSYCELQSLCRVDELVKQQKTRQEQDRLENSA